MPRPKDWLDELLSFLVPVHPRAKETIRDSGRDVVSVPAQVQPVSPAGVRDLLNVGR